MAFNIEKLKELDTLITENHDFKRHEKFKDKLAQNYKLKSVISMRSINYDKHNHHSLVKEVEVSKSKPELKLKLNPKTLSNTFVDNTQQSQILDALINLKNTKVSFVF